MGARKSVATKPRGLLRTAGRGAAGKAPRPGLAVRSGPEGRLGSPPRGSDQGWPGNGGWWWWGGVPGSPPAAQEQWQPGVGRPAGCSRGSEGPAAPWPGGRGALPRSQAGGTGGKAPPQHRGPRRPQPRGAGPGRELLARPPAGRGLRAGPVAVGSSFRFSLRLLVTV